MNILVIGNGFDLVHGLPTKYTDFLDFIKLLQKKQREKTMTDSFVVECFNEMLRQKRLTNDALKEIDISQYIDAINNFADVKNRDFWMQHFIYRETKMGGRWVDFEQEISDCVKIMETTPNDTRVDFHNTLEETRQYILTMKKGDVIRKLKKDLDDLNKSLELYMILVELIPIKKREEFNFVEYGKINCVVSFNYTSTFDKYGYGSILDTLFGEMEPFGENKNPNFIHGKAGDENVILGAGETLEEDAVNTELTCVKFKKYFQRIQKRTGGKYRNWLDEKSSEPGGSMHNIFIYGHSLDVTDKDILSDIILHEHTQKVTIYYYENGGKSDYEQSIINLIQVIGKEELTARVGDGRIEFISTKDFGGKS